MKANDNLSNILTEDDIKDIQQDVENACVSLLEALRID